MLATTLLLTLGACGDSEDADLTVKNQPPEEIYADARSLLAGKKYKDAIEPSILETLRITFKDAQTRVGTSPVVEDSTTKEIINEPVSVS